MDTPHSRKRKEEQVTFGTHNPLSRGNRYTQLTKKGQWLTVYRRHFNTRKHIHIIDATAEQKHVCPIQGLPVYNSTDN